MAARVTLVLAVSHFGTWVADWMPTPDDLDALSESSAPMAHKDQCRLLRAVRWLLEERDR